MVWLRFFVKFALPNVFDKEYFTKYFLHKASDHGDFSKNNHWWGSQLWNYTMNSYWFSAYTVVVSYASLLCFWYSLLRN